MRTISHRLASVFFLGLAFQLSCPNAVRADEALFSTADVCDTNGFVNKDKLADFLATKYPISILAMNKAPAETRSSSRELLAFLLKNTSLCEKDCAPTDRPNLIQIVEELRELSKGNYNGFALDRAASPESLLDVGPDAASIACSPKSATAPGSKSKSSSVAGSSVVAQLRIRGKPEDLSIDREDVEAFKGTDKASVSLVNDSDTHTRTADAHGAIGVSLLRPLGDGPRTDLVVYVGANRTSVKVNDEVKTDKSQNTVNTGLLFALFRPGSSFDYAVNLRPDYLVDHTDHSKIASFRGEYIPIVSWINRYQRLGPSTSSTFGKLTASIPVDVGRYLKRKDGAGPGDQPDFGHLGLRLGINLTSEKLPLDFSASYTALRPWRGDIDVNYLQSTLTLNFDSKKYFGLSASYVRGKREDTFKNERHWKLELTARY